MLHCVAAWCTAVACCSADGWALLDGAVLRTLLAVLHADAPRAATYEALWLASAMAVHATVRARGSERCGLTMMRARLSRASRYH